MSSWNGTDENANEIFCDLYEREYERLLHCAKALLKSKGDRAPDNGGAEVAVQEVFFLAWERRQEVLSRECPVGWLYSALHYKVLELLKDENDWQKRLLRYEQMYVPPVNPHISLKIELDGLVSEPEFDLLRQIYWAGYSYREVCENLNISKSALAAKVYRIKRNIRKKMEE